MRGKKDWIYLFILCLIVFSVSMFFSLFGEDAHHEGIMLKNAIDIANGKLLYRDSYTQYGALMTYIQAFFVLVFGQKMWAINLSAAFFLTMSFVVQYLLVKRYTSEVCSFWGNLLILGTAYFYGEQFFSWSSIYALFFLMMTMYCSVLFVENQREIYLVLGGIFTACAFWCRQPVGIVSILAVILLTCYFRVVLKMKELTKYFCIFAGMTMVTFMVFLLPYILSRGVEEWWIQFMQNAYTFMQSSVALSSDAVIEKPVRFFFVKVLAKCLFPYLGYHQYGLVMWTAVPIINLILLLISSSKILKFSFKKEKDKREIEIVCIIVFALASWHQYFPVPTNEHFFWGGFPMLGVAIIVFYLLYLHLLQKKQVIVQLLVITSMMVLCISQLVLNFDAAVEKIETHTYMVNDAHYPYMEGIRLSKEEALFYTDFGNIVYELEEKYPDKELFNYTRWNLLSCYTDGTIGPVYSLYGKDFCNEEEIKHYFTEKRPILISDQQVDELYSVKYVMYCSVDGIHGDKYKEEPQISIYVPKELWSKDNVTMEKESCE